MPGANEYRQGEGRLLKIKAIGPSRRVEGELLSKAEVKEFEFDIEFNGGLSINSLPVQLSDDPSTPIWDGYFSEEVDVDTLQQGTHILRYRTVLKNGKKSASSLDYIVDILPPLSLPNPPTIIGAE